MGSKLGIGALALAVILGLCGLGRWQLQRMAEKQALFAEFARGGAATVPLTEDAARYQHVTAAGRYDSRHQFLLDNMTHEGRVGYRVLTPFVAGERTVLVDRGWLPTPDIRVPENLRTLAGRLDLPPARGIDLAAAPAQGWPRVLTYPKMRDLEAALGRPVFPKILLLDADQPDGYVREWRPSTFPPERHLGYAITWFALAATVLVIFIVTNWKK